MSSARERLQAAMDKQRDSTPGIVQNVVLMEIADLLEELLEVTRESTAHGTLEQQLVSVGPTTTELTPSSIITMPWKSFVLAQGGPAPIFIAVNKNYFDSQVPIYPNEQFPFDMGQDKIVKILLTTTNPVTGAGGGNASVRFFSVK